MSTEQQIPREPKGKTIFQKYSTWNKGQHFVTVLQMVPGHHKKVLIGRIYMEKDGDQVTYIAKSADGKEVLGASSSYIDIEKRFATHGPELAAEEMQKSQARSQEKETTPPEQTPVAPAEKDAVDEIAEIRARGEEQEKDQSINR